MTLLRSRALLWSATLKITFFSSSSFSSLSRRSLKTYTNYLVVKKSSDVIDSVKVGVPLYKSGVNTQKEFLIQCMRDNDSDGAMNLIDALIRDDDTVNIKAFHPLLCLCSKKEHIPSALNMLDRMKIMGINPSEQVYVALVRCYCDDNAILDALKLVDTMLNASMVPKLRALLPILEAACRTNDVHHLIFIMQFMQQLNIENQAEPLTLFLEAVGRNGHLLSAKQHSDVNDLLHHAGNKLLGLPMIDMQRVAASFGRTSLESVQHDGVLVETLDDIRGAIMDSSALRVDGSVQAVDINFDGSVSQVVRALPRLTNVDPSIPIGQHSDYQLDGSEEAVREPAPPQKFVIRSVLEAMSSLHGAEANTARNSFSASSARIVHVSSTQCRCPNCLTVLEPSFVTEADRLQVRAALRNVSKPLTAQLDAFSAWLTRQEEFEYIVDGANVAYHNQNFKNGSGKFSFQQIELVVNKLRERGKRILVVIPHHYTLSTIPNSVGDRRREVVTEADKAVLKRLRDSNMLYVVPSGANDDWYWIYATLYKGRRSPAFVITNDLMRDHKVAFPEARTFMRWRTSQVVYFGLSSAFTEATEENNEQQQQQQQQHRDDLSDLYGEDVPEAFLYGPGDFSREIQHSEATDRWHIPAVDRSHWLCLKHSVASAIERQ